MLRAIVFVMLLQGCASLTASSETETALCEAWAQSLPTRSRADTEQTRAEIGQARATYRAVCE